MRRTGQARAAPVEGEVEGGAEAVTFDQLFRTQYEPMVRVAYLLLWSRDEAEDVVQDAFARVELRWSRLGNAGGYLRRCVVNRAHDALRHRQVQQRYLHGHHGDTTADLGADELADALAALPTKRRTAVVLRYYAGLDTREIADAMGVRPGTVKSLLHRALAQLREEIER